MCLQSSRNLGLLEPTAVVWQSATQVLAVSHRGSACAITLAAEGSAYGGMLKRRLRERP